MTYIYRDQDEISDFPDRDLLQLMLRFYHLTLVVTSTKKLACANNSKFQLFGPRTETKLSTSVNVSCPSQHFVYFVLT